MARHNDTGKLGEAWASDFLCAQGHQILHRNWRAGRAEIDLITLKNHTIHLVEVKTRTTNGYEYPEQRIGQRKWQQLHRAWVAFREKYPGYAAYQLDILAIQGEKQPTFFFDRRYPECPIPNI